jgi:DNA-directed RNA polymerase omega subunit
MQYNSRGEDIDTDLCVEKIGNKYDLVIAASARAREIMMLNRHSTRFDHLHTPVTALLEIQEGKIGAEYIKKTR